MNFVHSRRKRYRMRFRFGAIMVATVSTFFASIYFEEQLYNWALIPMTVLLIVSVSEFVFADIITDRKYPKRTGDILERLERCLHDFEKHITDSINDVIQNLDVTDKTKVTGTFHLEVEKYTDGSSDDTESALVQIVKYTSRLGGRQWRLRSITKGIIGRCLRLQTEDYANFADQNEFNERMIKEFGFTRGELAKITENGRSYYAHPVFSGKKVIGVLYLFSTETNIFPKAIKPGDINCCCKSIAGFLNGANIISNARQ